MLKSPRLALGLAAILLTGGANAQNYITPKGFQSQTAARTTATRPAADHQGQWWTHPLGCEYSRAGLPGETVWYIIVNTMRNGCPHRIVIESHSGVY
ncbi:hypothetical protein FDP25_03305 [Roseovarius sp. A21]|uniref:Uncharacterized protein n=1 Tax=Roseovarius bejariae TaxID=2576383 RepID=A0A844CXU6_9RHOB|nr:hypothetical protein [Roseovarius bejariae]MRU14453.1 hypothetical protein [Roseovarius bejariae]